MLNTSTGIFGDFIWRALIAGVGVAVCGAPLGCFMVWRRMAYFGDTLSHAALLGVAMGFLFRMDVTLGVLLTAVLVAVLLWSFKTKQRLTTDSFLAILTHTSLALGLIVISLLPQARIDLMGYLVGDILTVTVKDVLRIYIVGFGMLGVVVFCWRAFITITLHEELAFVEGIPVSKMQLTLFLLMAFFVAVGMQLVGVLLLSALLIVPAATARFFAHTPEQMAVLAGLVGVVSVAGGILLSLFCDLPAGPAIVVLSSAFFLVGHVKNRLSHP